MRGQGGRPRIYGEKHAGRDEEDDEEEKGEEGRKAGGMEGYDSLHKEGRAKGRTGDEMKAMIFRTRKEEQREGQETRCLVDAEKLLLTNVRKHSHPTVTVRWELFPYVC